MLKAVEHTVYPNSGAASFKDPLRPLKGRNEGLLNETVWSAEHFLFLLPAAPRIRSRVMGLILAERIIKRYYHNGPVIQLACT